jgi:hypothetical protein
MTRAQILRAGRSLSSALVIALCAPAVSACCDDVELDHGATLERTVTIPATDTVVSTETCWNGMCASGSRYIRVALCDACSLDCGLDDDPFFVPGSCSLKPAVGEDWDISVEWQFPSSDGLEDGDVYEVHMSTASNPHLVDVRKSVTYTRDDGACDEGMFATL